MNRGFGRLARALLLTGGLATAIALPSLAGAPLIPSDADQGARIALAAPASDNDGNDDPTNDNSDERNIEGQIIELHAELNPPEALVGMVGGNVWARLYNNQLHNSGVGVGDYVQMQGEYGEHGIFDGYQVNVTDRWGGDNDNGNDND
jgi:hypothetical protein